MKKIIDKGADLFDKLVLDHPILTIIIFLVFIAFFSYHAQDFRIDASSETLLNENNKELKNYRAISKRYESKEFIIITYKPYNNDLFSPEILSNIARLKKEIEKLKRVESVTTILDVPLIETAQKMNIKDLTKNIPTIQTPGIDISLAKKEFKTSPLYKNLLVSPDLEATAIQVILKPTLKYNKLIEERTMLAEKSAKQGLTKEEKIKYKNLNK
jgi:predicted RND superfamily exporter protein